MTLGLNTAHDASGISYLASDGLGSVSEALSPSGSATGAQLYSPYGGVRYSTGTLPTSKGFTGQYADTASSGSGSSEYSSIYRALYASRGQRASYHCVFESRRGGCQ